MEGRIDTVPLSVLACEVNTVLCHPSQHPRSLPLPPTPPAFRQTDSRYRHAGLSRSHLTAL